MNVLCIGYYDKHSRFFLAIKKELSKNIRNLNFKMGSIYISGYLYYCFRFKSSYWFPLKAWIKVFKNKRKYLSIISSTDVYKNIYYKKLIEFHTRLNCKISKEDLLMQTLAYLDLFDDYFTYNKPDIILVLGDSRLCIESCIALSEQKKIKTYFIEQGPFNSTIFNGNGVNANLDVNIDFDSPIEIEAKKTVDHFINSTSKLKYNRSYIYRLFDLMVNFLFTKNRLVFPPDLKYTDVFTIPIFNKGKHLPPLLNEEKTIFLLIFQLPLDVNMIYHSPFFDNHYQILKAIYKNLPHGVQLIIREHPIYRGKYEKELYKYAEKNNIYFDNNKDLEKVLDKVKVVIVINSTVGIQALVHGKTIVTLGNSYYNKSKICINYTNDSNLEDLLKKSIEFTPSKVDIDTFLYNFIESSLVEGSINDKNLIVTKTIAQKIISEFNFC